MFPISALDQVNQPYTGDLEKGLVVKIEPYNKPSSYGLCCNNANSYCLTSFYAIQYIYGSSSTEGGTWLLEDAGKGRFYIFNIFGNEKKDKANRLTNN